MNPAQGGEKRTLSCYQGEELVTKGLSSVPEALLCLTFEGHCQFSDLSVFFVLS